MNLKRGKSGDERGGTLHNGGSRRGITQAEKKARGKNKEKKFYKMVVEEEKLLGSTKGQDGARGGNGMRGGGKKKTKTQKD